MNRPADLANRPALSNPCGAVRCGGVPLKRGHTHPHTPLPLFAGRSRVKIEPSRTVPHHRPANCIFPLHGPKDSVGDLSPWTDDLAWCARIGALPTVGERRVVLREWGDAAGGWSDAAAVHLPSALPAGLALAWIRTHARALRLDVHEDLTCPDPVAVARDALLLLSSGRAAMAMRVLEGLPELIEA